MSSAIAISRSLTARADAGAIGKDHGDKTAAGPVSRSFTEDGRLTLEGRLQIHVAVVASLGATMLGLGQPLVDGLPVAAVGILSAVASLIFADFRGQVRISSVVANTVALAAVLWSAGYLWHRGADSQLTAIANLLVYLQAVLMFQRKTTRVYWQLLILSMLEVVVASALNLGVAFGALLVAYLFGAISALMTFYWFREHRPPRPPRGRSERIVHRIFLTLFPPTPVNRPAWMDAAAAPESAGNEMDAAARWPTSRQAAVFAAVSLVLAGLFFFALPRATRQGWQSQVAGIDRMVGFNPSVELGNFGAARLSDAPVMRVHFYDRDSGDPIRPAINPYLRGGVLIDYEDGRWRERPGPREDISDRLPTPPQRSNMTRQEFVMESARQATLFTVVPAYEEPGFQSELRYDPMTEAIFRPVDARTDNAGRFRYALVTDGILRGVQREVAPLVRPLFPSDITKLRAIENGGERLPTLTRIAQQTLADARVDPATDPFGAAKALTAHFLAPGRYFYSLDPDVSGDRGLDPAEDFVANHRTGHCEYFATALALMLRQEGIPARIALGYHPHEFNSVGKYYQVRDRDAHAWVEVYLAPGQIPQALLEGGEDDRYGVWLRLDPTPTSDTLMLQGDITWWQRLKETVGYAQTLWSDYVLELNAQRQREAIYAPLIRLVQKAPEIAGPSRWRRWLHDFISALREGKFTAWLAGAVFCVGVAALVGRYVWRTVVRRDAKESGRSRAAASRFWRRVQSPPHPATASFRRFERLARRIGFRRKAGQTPLEFAELLSRKIEKSNGRPNTAADVAWPTRFVAAYYRLRFGSETVSAEEAAALTERLKTLPRLSVLPSAASNAD